MAIIIPEVYSEVLKEKTEGQVKIAQFAVEFLIRSNKIGWQTFRVILGSILYRALMYVARRYGSVVGLGPNDLKLITGLLIIVCLIISKTNISAYFKEHLKRPSVS